MREVINSTAFALPADEVWRLLFADPSFQEHFHGAAGATVSHWHAGRRVVTFTKALNLPGPLLRLLGGLSSLNVVEEQTHSLADNGYGTEVRTVLATPVSVGLERFKTFVTHTLTPVEKENGAGPRCELHTRIEVVAPCIPGFVGLLESQMHSVASSSLAEMYEKSHLYVKGVLAAEEEKRCQAAAVPSSPVAVTSCAEPAAEPMSVQPVHAPLPQPIMRASSIKRRRGLEGGIHKAVPTNPLESLRRSGSLRLRRLTHEP